VRDVGKTVRLKVVKQVYAFLDQIADHRDPALEPVGVCLAIVEHGCRQVSLDLVGEYRSRSLERHACVSLAQPGMAEHLVHHGVRPDGIADERGDISARRTKSQLL
jgi:hypothetical protein